MPRYRVEQYIVDVDVYEVAADDRVSAIKKILEGDGELLHTNYSYADDSRGMPIKKFSAEEIERLDYDENNLVPSIRDVIRID